MVKILSVVIWAGIGAFVMSVLGTAAAVLGADGLTLADCARLGAILGGGCRGVYFLGF